MTTASERALESFWRFLREDRALCLKAVEFLRESFPAHVKDQLVGLIQHNPETWWVSSHSGWSMALRNALRTDVGISDEQLPPAEYPADPERERSAGDRIPPKLG